MVAHRSGRPALAVMPSRPAQLVPGQPKVVWLQADTITDLLEFRREGDRPDDIVARLIRFAKRYRLAAEAHIQEEFLP